MDAWFKVKTGNQKSSWLSWILENGCVKLIFVFIFSAYLYYCCTMLCSQVMEYTVITDIRQILMFMKSKKGTGKYNKNVVIFKAEMLRTDISVNNTVEENSGIFKLI